MGYADKVNKISRISTLSTIFGGKVIKDNVLPMMRNMNIGMNYARQKIVGR